jgi:hypothetical protein
VVKRGIDCDAPSAAPESNESTTDGGIPGGEELDGSDGSGAGIGSSSCESGSGARPCRPATSRNTLPSLVVAAAARLAAVGAGTGIEEGGEEGGGVVSGEVSSVITRAVVFSDRPTLAKSESTAAAAMQRDCDTTRRVMRANSRNPLDAVRTASSRQPPAGKAK